MTWTRRRFLNTAVLSAAAGLGARTPAIARTLRPVTVSHSVSTFVAVPEWQWAAEGEGFGRAVYDVLDEKAWNRFKREDVLRSVKYGKTIFDWDLVIEEKDHENGIKVWVPTAVDKPIPYGKAVNVSFVRKAQAKYKS